MLCGADAVAEVYAGADADADDDDADVEGMQHVLAAFAPARRASANAHAAPDRRTMTTGVSMRLPSRATSAGVGAGGDESDDDKIWYSVVSSARDTLHRYSVASAPTRVSALDDERTSATRAWLVGCVRELLAREGRAAARSPSPYPDAAFVSSSDARARVLRPPPCASPDEPGER
jgi:hypothetical protein